MPLVLPPLPLPLPVRAWAARANRRRARAGIALARFGRGAERDGKGPVDADEAVNGSELDSPSVCEVAEDDAMAARRARGRKLNPTADYLLNAGYQY